MSEKPSYDESPEIAPIDPAEMSFEQLRGAFELARITFRRTENGFENVEGEGIYIKQLGENYIINGFVPRGYHKLHAAMMQKGAYDSILRKGSPDKEAMLQAIHDLLIQTENRVID